MTTYLFFTIPYFSKHFILHINALNKGLRTVLLHEDHPVAFLGQALSENSQTKSFLISCRPLADITNSHSHTVSHFQGFYRGITQSSRKARTFSLWWWIDSEYAHFLNISPEPINCLRCRRGFPSRSSLFTRYSRHHCLRPERHFLDWVISMAGTNYQA